MFYTLIMSIEVKIPNGKLKEEYSLYVSGYIKAKFPDENLGTMLFIEGTAIAFYSASNSRRAVIFQELKENDFTIPMEEAHMPYIKQEVRILYKAKGRKIDLLKQMVYNLEKKYGKDFYKYGTLYWLTLASYIDSVRHKSKGSNGTKRQVYLLTDKYKKSLERSYESL